MGMTLARYFGLRFLNAALATFVGVMLLVALIDYIELMRRTADMPGVSALTVAKTSLFRVPQVAERILPFCMLIGAMSCFLNLSRRLELVVARAAGLSAWGFTAPAAVGGVWPGRGLPGGKTRPGGQSATRPCSQTPGGRTASTTGSPPEAVVSSGCRWTSTRTHCSTRGS